MLKGKGFKVLTDLIVLTAACFIFAFAWESFMIPNGMSAGGMMGLCTVIQYATGGLIPAQYSYFAVNALLIIVAIIALPLSIALALASGVGPEEGIYTAIIAGFLISFLGGSRVQIAGPTAAFATIVAGIVATSGMDGLIVATPTGSTAYSLAAGGPVLMPDSGSFVVTPMIPHTLAVRPFVVRDSARIAITSRARANGRAEPLGVYADGEAVFRLDGDETIEIERAPGCARLVELDGYDPYDVLARKLGWLTTGGNGR